MDVSSKLSSVDFKSLSHNSVVLDGDFSPDSSRVIFSSDDRTISYADIELNSFFKIGDRGYDFLSYYNLTPVTSVSFSPDGQSIVTGSTDDTARIWDVSTGKTKTILEGHSYNVTSVSFSPDGCLLYTSPSPRDQRGSRMPSSA